MQRDYLKKVKALQTPDELEKETQEASIEGALNKLSDDVTIVEKQISDFKDITTSTKDQEVQKKKA